MQFGRKFYMADERPGGPTPDDIRNTESLNDRFNRLRDTLVSISEILKNEFSQQIEDFDDIAKKTAQITIKDLGKSLGDATKHIKDAQIQQRRVGKELIESSKIEAQINKLKDSQVSIASTLQILESQGLALTEAQLIAVNDIETSLKEQLEIYDEQLKLAKQLEATIGKLGQAFKGLTRIPIVGQLINAQTILTAMTKAAATSGSKWKALWAGIGAAFKSIGQSLKDPAVLVLGLIALFKKAFDIIVAFNKKTFELAQNLGVSVSQASKLQQTFVEISTDSKNLGITSTELAKSFTEISQVVGFLVPANREFAETALLIQKRFGATAEQVAALGLQSALNGKTLMQTFKTIEATRVVEGARNKIALSTRQIFEAIAKTSSAVLINFKGSTAALTEAITRATKLGTSLDTVNKQAESLLDFESSISKEFEAQILTGRNINLTRARELALLGDTRGLMEELNNQQIRYDEFQNQTVIARRAEAEAIGLSVEELSKILLQQKLSEQLGAAQGVSLQEQYNLLVQQGLTRDEIAKKITKESEQDLYRASIQDKLNTALEKFKETLAILLEGPLTSIVDKFASFVSNASEMNKLANNLKKTFDGIASVLGKLPALLANSVTIAKTLASLSIARAVASVVAAAGFAGPAGLVAGALAGGAMYAWLSSLMDGGGAGSPSVPTGGGSETMAAPLNTATVLAQSNKTAAAEAAAKPPVINLKNTTYVGTENWSNTTKYALQSDYGLTLS